MFISVSGLGVDDGYLVRPRKMGVSWFSGACEGAGLLRIENLEIELERLIRISGRAIASDAFLSILLC